MPSKDDLTILFYPSFDNSEEFTDHYYRMLWYLNPLRERIRRIIMPYEGESPNLGELPYYLDPAIKQIADGFGITNAVELVSSEHTDLLKNAAKEADVVLVWRVDGNKRGRVPDGLLKPLVLRKKRYLVDHKNVRYAGSFYLRLSAEICSKKTIVEECREKFNRIPANNFNRIGYIYGTGPSLQAALDMDLSDGTSIVCNTMVKNRELMKKLRPPLIVFSDPIFHAGPSTYAGDFRRDVQEAMAEFDSYAIVPMRDYALYTANMNPSLRERIIGVPIIPPNITPDLLPNLNLYKKFHVTPTTSVLTLFLIPLAATFFEKTFVLGCDGRPLSQDDYFWKHDPASQLVDRMDDIKVAHPAFFAIDYHDFYLEHCRVVARWLDEAERQGKQFFSLTPSYIPALKTRQAASFEISTQSLARPIVSIVMPASNASGSIADAIASIQSQSVIDWELLVVDDGSTDDTRKIVQGLAETDPRIRLLQCKGKGVSDARNTGLDEARGEFITFLDADDFMYRDALKRRVEALATKPGWNLVHCITEVVGANSRKLGWQLGRMVEVTFKDMSGNPCHLNSLMGRSEIFKSVRFQSGLTNGEDWLFFSDIFRTGEVSHRVDNCSVAYVVRHDSVVCRDYLSHENTVSKVLDMIYSPVRNNMTAASEFIQGLSSPPKEIVALRRKIGLLTWLLLEQRADDVAAVLSEFNARALSALSRAEIRHQITYPAMRFYVCRQEELPNEFRKDRLRILRLISETGIEKTFPQYVRELKSLMRKPYIHEVIRVRGSRLYQRFLGHLIMKYPSIITIGRFVKWGLAKLKRNLFGIGGMALFVIAALYIAGALVEPARWYLVGLASALLLLSGGLLALFYARTVLNRVISDQRIQIAGINKQLSDMNKQVSDINKALHESEASLRKEISELNVGNVSLFQQANRRLAKQDLKHFAEEWVPKLGLNLNYAAMGYIAHRICLAEDTCIGRLAGSIETMLLRVLVARSVKDPNLEVLEIGTLFGTGIAMIHENCLGLFNSVHFTVIDPLIGHIGPNVEGPLDSWIKTPATREIFIHNMQRMNIPESDYTIIQKFSTEDEAKEQASKRRYDILIVDGDHSDAGVRHDFFNYGHLVKPGGYIIFDDYGNPRWPGLTRFIDEEVAEMPDLESVGTDVFAAVFRVIAPQDLTKRGRKQHK
ncbi:MAG: glycosyltransferase [Dehalococcoidia bacterium]